MAGMKHLRRPLLFVAIVAASLSTTRAAQAPPQGVTYRAPSGVTLRLILDENNVGQGVSLGEMTFPPGMDSGDPHTARSRSSRISGTPTRGQRKSEMLEPGMVIMKRADTVRHGRNLRPVKPW